MVIKPFVSDFGIVNAIRVEQLLVISSQWVCCPAACVPDKHHLARWLQYALEFGPGFLLVKPMEGLTDRHNIYACRGQRRLSGRPRNASETEIILQIPFACLPHLTVRFHAINETALAREPLSQKSCS